MPSQKRRKPKFGDAWKNTKSDPAEMDSLFDKFVRQPKKVESEDDADAPLEPRGENSVHTPPQEATEVQRTPLSETIFVGASETPSDNILPWEAPTVGLAPTVGNKPTVGVNPTVSPKKPVPKGRFSIGIEVADALMERLAPLEKLVYFRLYRLAYGFGREVTDPVGATAIARWCRISKDSALDMLKSLTDKGLISLVERVNTQSQKGSRWHVATTVGYEHTVGLKPTVGNNPTVGTIPTVGPNPTIIDDDDYNRDIDLHQKETMRIYQSLTKNKWKSSDQTAYEKIKAIDLKKIEQGMQTVIRRAPSRPNSLAYFVKEILDQAQPKEQGREQKKRALKKIVENVRAIHTGERGYRFPDFVEDVKRRCARDGVLFDNDLFNEIID